MEIPDSIFDVYTAEELNAYAKLPPNRWPEPFRDWVNRNFSNELLDSWLEAHDEDEYNAWVKEFVNNWTEGY
jgi:hypothetical protein